PLSGTSNETSETISISLSAATTRSPATVTPDGSDTRFGRAWNRAGSPPDAVDDQVHTDREQGDRRGRNDDRPGLDGETIAVLPDHQPPVGGGWLEPEPDEAQGGDEQDRGRKP